MTSPTRRLTPGTRIYATDATAPRRGGPSIVHVGEVDSEGKIVQVGARTVPPGRGAAVPPGEPALGRPTPAPAAEVPPPDTGRTDTPTRRQIKLYGPKNRYLTMVEVDGDRDDYTMAGDVFRRRAGSRDLYDMVEVPTAPAGESPPAA